MLAPTLTPLSVTIEIVLLATGRQFYHIKARDDTESMLSLNRVSEIQSRARTRNWLAGARYKRDWRNGSRSTTSRNHCLENRSSTWKVL